MFGRHKEKKRSKNPVLILFRLILSLTVFAALLGGLYFAYKQFSGVDPLKLDPKNSLFSLINSNEDVRKVFTKVLGINKDNKIIPVAQGPDSNASGHVEFSFLLVADSHNDNVNLGKAINQAKQIKPLQFIIGLGDYTQVGTLDELKKAKVELDKAGIRYFLVSGDHDLWDSRNRKIDPLENFTRAFGPSFQSFTYGNFRFLLIDNSDDYLGLGEKQLEWVSDQLERAKTEEVKGIFVMLHEPLFHPSSDHVMGKTEKGLKNQAQSLIYQFKASGVRKVFAGDIHFFTQYLEGQTNLPMMTVGAITSERNTQAPRFAIVDVYSDGETRVNDIEIK